MQAKIWWANLSITQRHDASAPTQWLDGRGTPYPSNTPHYRPATVEELMDNIGKETWVIDTATCRHVIDNFARRVMACIRQNGGHLEHILDAYN